MKFDRSGMGLLAPGTPFSAISPSFGSPIPLKKRSPKMWFSPIAWLVEMACFERIVVL
jgi:hypothetical protein